MVSSERAWHRLSVVLRAAAMTSCGVADGPDSERGSAKSDTAAQAAPEGMNSAPAIRLVSPRDGQVFSATDGAVEFVAEVTIPHEQVSVVRFLSDGGEIVKVASPPYRVMYSPSQLGEGSHLLRAVAVTNRGALESMPATIKVRPPVEEEITADELSAMTIGENNVVVRIYLPKATSAIALRQTSKSGPPRSRPPVTSSTSRSSRMDDSSQRASVLRTTTRGETCQKGLIRSRSERSRPRAGLRTPRSRSMSNDAAIWSSSSMSKRWSRRAGVLLPAARPNRARACFALAHPRRVRSSRSSRVLTHPAKIHPWQWHDSRRPAVYFVPEIRTHPPSPSSTCDRLHRGARLLLIATTASDCDTTPYRGLCLLHPLAIAHEATARDREDAAR